MKTYMMVTRFALMPELIHTREQDSDLGTLTDGIKVHTRWLQYKNKVDPSTTSNLRMQVLVSIRYLPGHDIFGLSPHRKLANWDNIAELMVMLGLHKTSYVGYDRLLYPHNIDLQFNGIGLCKTFEMLKYNHGIQDKMLMPNNVEINWICGSCYILSFCCRHCHTSL